MGEKICRSLQGRFDPSLVIYEKGGLEDVLGVFDQIVAVMAVGIVVRLLCNLLRDKWTDKPVLVVDRSLRSAVPVVGGHHGANDLAIFLAQRMGLYPAITTATDSAGRPSLEGTARGLGADIVIREPSREINLAFLQQDVPLLRLKGPKIVVVDRDVAVLTLRGLVVGLGARRGVTAGEVLDAVDAALQAAGRSREDIGVLATARLKKDEKGIAEAAEVLGKKVVYLSEDVLNAQEPSTPSRASRLGLAGVAEPAVLALAERLVLPKRAYGRVTVALGE